MLDPTEGVPHSKVGSSFLRRNLGKDIDLNKLQSEDRQELWIDVSTYRIFFTIKGVAGRPYVYRRLCTEDEGRQEDEALSRQTAKREEKMRQKFVNRVGGISALSEDEAGHRLAAWERALREGLWTLDESSDNVHAPRTQEDERVKLVM